MASLQHILASDSPETAKVEPVPISSTTFGEERQQQTSEEESSANTIDQLTKADHDQTQIEAPRGSGSDLTGVLASITDSKNGAPGVLAANKMRHLKKEDGIPLWRKDIQYDFLRKVFYDPSRCFTKYSEKKSGFTFAEVYIDAMAKSSKCSKILKEKLLSDIDGAISMAMVCLLVNLGRMNTTLNFFPEMRAQLRTYHSIPALQAHQDPNAYKQLQDAPRLKSILKGATEDEPQPWSVEEIKAAPKPRTNAVNLIFILSSGSSKVSDVHFDPPRDFFDLVMRPDLSSHSRARAFLWLMWWYLESDFTKEDSQAGNPFGSGLYGKDDDPDGVPQKVPALESLTDEEMERENVDTESEKVFGEVKRKARIAILASEPSPAMVALKRARKGKGDGNGYRSEDDISEVGWYNSGEGKASGPRSRMFDTDSVHTRSPSPVNGRQSTGTPDVRIRALLNNEDNAVERTTNPIVKKGPGRGNWRRNRGRIDGTNTSTSAKTGDAHQLPLLPNTSENGADAGTPGSAGYRAYSSFPIQGASPSRGGTMRGSDHVPTPSYQAQKRHRGVTQHQSALISHRRAQMDYMLDRTIQRIHITARQAREHEGSILRAWKRIRHLPTDYDSEEEFIRSNKGREREKDEDGRATRAGAKDADENVDLVAKGSGLYLAGFGMSFKDDDGDVGEEAKHLARTLRRIGRRLDRWQDRTLPGETMIKRKRRSADSAGGKRRKVISIEQHSSPENGAASNHVTTLGSTGLEVDYSEDELA